MRTTTALLALGMVVAGFVAVAPVAAAEDCQNLVPPNGFAGVYLCPGNRIEVRQSGTLLATGPTSGIGWYVTSGSVYVAAEFICSGDYCYVAVAAFPVTACVVAFSIVNSDVYSCLGPVPKVAVHT